MPQHIRVGTPTAVKTELQGRFVSIYSRLVGNLARAHRVDSIPIAVSLSSSAMGMLSVRFPLPFAKVPAPSTNFLTLLTETHPNCTVQSSEMESLWAPRTTDKTGTIVVSALNARANFGKLLDRVSDGRHSLVIEKRGTPKAVLLSIRDYVKLAAPEPEVLRILGAESERNGTNALTSRQIDQIIKTTRAQKKKR